MHPRYLGTLDLTFTLRLVLIWPWQLTDESLHEILQLLPLGLKALFPSLSGPILTLLPPSPSTSLPLLLLQLSSPSPLIILPSPLFLTKALTSSAHPKAGIIVVHVSLFDDVVEQVLEDCGQDVVIVIVGDVEKGKHRLVESAKGRGMRVVWWEDIWAAAENAAEEGNVSGQFS
jgi:long-chain acyl-CoA synthetase